MRLCVVSDFFVPHYQGGGERRYYEILKRLVKKGYYVDLLCMGINGVERYEYVEGIHVHHIGPTINSPPNRSIADFISFILSTLHWLLTHDYDVVEANTWVPLIPVWIAGMFRRMKTTEVIHDLSSGNPDQWLRKSKRNDLVERFLLMLPFSHVICVSDAVKSRLIREFRLNEASIDVFYDGVDIGLIDSVRVAKRDKDTVVYVGRLVPHKHVDHLIKAVKLLKKSIPSLKLKVIGGGQQLEMLKAQAAEYGLEKTVSFFGVIPEYRDMIRELKKSCLLVLPSTREGFGIVLVEAFASRVPAIAYRSDGVNEVIDDGLNGFLVRQGNIKELSAKIKILLKDKKKAHSFARQGREKAQRLFDWNKIADGMDGFYQGLFSFPQKPAE